MIQQSLALLVEDDPFMRSAVADFLDDSGYGVLKASTYMQAMEQLQQVDLAALHLAVLDIYLPFFTDDDESARRPLGLDLCRSIKEMAPHCGVLLWSAYSHHTTDVAKLISQGMTGVAFATKGSRMSTIQRLLEIVREGGVKINSQQDAFRIAHVATYFLNALGPELAEIVQKTQKRLSELSPRQLQVVQRIPRSADSIALELSLSTNTVRNYIDAAYGRLGLRDGLLNGKSYRNETVAMLAVILDDLLNVPPESA